MTFDANNFIFFYLILAIYALAIGLVAYAARGGKHKQKGRQHRGPTS